ncbi:MAG: hypothetical protein HQM12_16095 [SAR324 cluster bacterium]|nr:hypothetical protein [SAR324 cluster bacterium]
MLLLERAEKCNEAVSEINILSSQIDEAQQLNTLNKELEQNTIPLNQLTLRNEILKASKIQQSPLNTDPVHKEVKEFLQRFKQAPQSSTLKGKKWTNLIQHLDEIHKVIDRQQKEDWKNFIRGIFGGEQPEVIEGRIARTPDNVKKLNQYKKLYREFKAQIAMIPDTMEGISKIREAAQSLAEIQFDYAVPEAVKIFFEATTRGGASLTLLTDEVLQWLRNNNVLGNYLVHTRN